jgi:membrane-associated protease RseP (regulator of RpoE activity)
MLAETLLLLSLNTIAAPFQEPAATDGPGSDRRYTVMTQFPASTVFRTEVNTAEGRTLGLRLVEPDPALRAQVELPDKEGLVVAGIERSGAFHAAGLLVGDILLAFDGKPVTSEKALAEQVEGVKAASLSLKLLRQGKAVTMELKTSRTVQFLPANPEARYTANWSLSQPDRDYYLGFHVRPLDGILRSHLKLEQTGKNWGLVVEDVVAGGPAEKAGLKPGDVLLSLNKVPLYNVDFLRVQAQASEGKAIPFESIRGGKTTTGEITPVRRPEAAEGSQPVDNFGGRAALGSFFPQSVSADNVAVWPQPAQGQTSPVWFVSNPNTSPDSAALQQQIAELKAQVEALKKVVETPKDAKP